MRTEPSAGSARKGWQTVEPAASTTPQGSRSERMLKAVPFQPVRGPGGPPEIVDLPEPHPGPGQVRIAVRAAGVNPSDWKKRMGLMDPGAPADHGPRGGGSRRRARGGALRTWPSAIACSACPPRGRSPGRAGGVVLLCADPAVRSASPGAAALCRPPSRPATRALDQLGVGSGDTLLISGASRRASAAPPVQLAVVCGARVIGTASPANHEYLRSLRAEPVAYGEGLVGRVRALRARRRRRGARRRRERRPARAHRARGRAPEHVVTIADFGGAREHGVRFSSGDSRPRGPRARRDRRADRVRALLAPGRADLPARRDRGGAPCPARTVTCAGSSCCWLADAAAAPARGAAAGEGVS